MNEEWEEHRKKRSAKKKRNKEYSTKLIVSLGHKVESFANGIHLIITTHGGKVIDFWPSTGKWKDTNVESES